MFKSRVCGSAANVAGSRFQACGRAAMEKALEPQTVRDRGMLKMPSCAER